MWADNIEAAPDIKEARELALKSSPVSSFANWRSPVLFVHGDDDRNVPFQQTTDLVEKPRAQRVAGATGSTHSAPPPNSSPANWLPPRNGNKPAAVKFRYHSRRRPPPRPRNPFSKITWQLY